MQCARFILAFLFVIPVFGCVRAVVSPGVGLVPSAAPVPLASPAHKTVSVALQPFGRIPADRIALAKATIAARFNATVSVLPTVPLPRAAYYSPRGRYRAERLLDYLTRTTPPAYDKVIGMTESDISTTKGEYADWGIFGLGNLSDRACVVSSYRLRNVPTARFHARYQNLVIHEFGHTLGLNHCPTPDCVMQDAQGTVRAVDEETGAFCRLCRQQIAAYLR